jgi:hypothetical protein
MDEITGLHEWDYAGETYAVDKSGEVRRASSWNNGKPTWTPVKRPKEVRLALDACGKEIAELSLMLDVFSERED